MFINWPDGYLEVLAGALNLYQKQLMEQAQPWFDPKRTGLWAQSEDMLNTLRKLRPDLHF